MPEGWRAARQTLVIQEETIDRGVLPMLMKSLGECTSCPDSPQHAVQLLGQRQFDVVLTEINFLTVSGIELIDAVRKGTGPNAETPILIVTSDDCDETRRQAISAGADGYLIKPIARATLEDEITKAVIRRVALICGTQRGEGRRQE